MFARTENESELRFCSIFLKLFLRPLFHCSRLWYHFSTSHAHCMGAHLSPGGVEFHDMLLSLVAGCTRRRSYQRTPYNGLKESESNWVGVGPCSKRDWDVKQNWLHPLVRCYMQWMPSIYLSLVHVFIFERFQQNCRVFLLYSLFFGFICFLFGACFTFCTVQCKEE